MENIKTLIQENKDWKKVCCVHSIAETAVIWKWKTTIIMMEIAAVHTKDAGCHPVRKLVQHFNGKDALYEC